MNKLSGIYKIESPTGGIYIGQSLDIRKRFSEYKRLKCKSQPCLYNSFIKHGFSYHKLEILEICSPQQLDEKERQYIYLYNSFNSKYGMNLTDGGGSNGRVSDKTKLKISIGNKGKIVSEESKIKMSNAQKKRGHEISKLISERNIGNQYGKGHKMSKELIDKLRLSRKENPAPMLGKRHTEITINKMRTAKIGKIVSKETGNKISKALKGRVMSEDHKEKIRQARLGKKYPRIVYESQ